MSSSSQRAQPRVKYPADVRLFADRFEEPLSGRARDLGPSGIFVEADERLSIGTPVICEVTLPSGPVRLTGLVTREQPLAGKSQSQEPTEAEMSVGSVLTTASRVGLGIHFINVDEAIRAEIEALIPADERARPLVAVHIEGMKEALRSPVELTEDGANVIATLPSLRQGNEVKLAFLSGAPTSPDGNNRSVVRDVRLVEPGADGSPRLELRLQFLPEEQQPSGKRTRTDFPPKGDVSFEGMAPGLPGLRAGDEGETENNDDQTEVTAIHTPSGIAAASLGHIIMRDRALTQTAERPAETAPVQLRAANIVKHRTHRVMTPVATVTPAPVKAPAAAEEDRILPPTTSRATRVAAMTAGGLALIALGVGLGQLLSKPPVPAKGVSVDRASGGEMPAGGSARGTEAAVQEPAVAAAPPATSVSVNAPGAAVPAESPPVGATAGVATEPAAPAETEPSRAVAPVDPAGTAAPSHSPTPPSTAPRAAMATADATARAGIDLLPPGTPGPEVITNPGEITAVVPVTGSTAGAVKYPLTRPHGIAIDLPEASATLALGRHAIFNDGFRFVSIRPRAGGGIRVAFTYAYYTPRLLDVTVDDTAVRVRVAPPSRPAAP